MFVAKMLKAFNYFPQQSSTIDFWQIHEYVSVFGEPYF